MKKVKLYEITIDLNNYRDSGVLLFTTKPIREDVVAACSALVLEAENVTEPDPDEDYDGYEADERAAAIEWRNSLREAAERMKPLDGETGTQDATCAGVSLGHIHYRTTEAWSR